MERFFWIGFFLGVGDGGRYMIFGPYSKGGIHSFALIRIFLWIALDGEAGYWKKGCDFSEFLPLFAILRGLSQMAALGRHQFFHFLITAKFTDHHKPAFYFRRAFVLVSGKTRIAIWY
jgi:hypothetical protein